MVHINKKLRAIVVFISLVVMNISACQDTRDKVFLPTPESKCSTELDWRGLIPGQSTRDDVERVLGTPFEKGKIKFHDRNVSYYAYKVDGGEISKYALDRIFFRSDGLIDWMEIIEADRNGDFEAVFDTVAQLGNKVDTVYSNNNYRPSVTFGDVMGWPDQVYVWASCGLALDALPSTYSPSFQADRQECKPTNSGDPILDVCSLVPQHPNPTYAGGQPGPDINGVILMKFYFQPTSYDAFIKTYLYRIPYGLWDEYLMKNK